MTKNNIIYKIKIICTHCDMMEEFNTHIVKPVDGVWDTECPYCYIGDLIVHECNPQ